MKQILLLALVAGLVCTSLPAGTIHYTHDRAGRLVSADYGDGRTITHTYDDAGNLTQLVKGAAVLPDGDGDHMDDAWERDQFGTTARDGTGDFDEDGFCDLAEFLARTLPKDPTSLLRTQLLLAPGSGTTAVEWQSVPGQTYRLQYKDSLKDPDWQSLPGDVTALAETASKIDFTTSGQSHRFYRILLIQ